VRSHIFQVVLEADRFEDGAPAIHASCPALPGCHTWGRTEREALARLAEAIELYLEDLRESGEPIPDDPGRGALALPSPAVVVNL
jgi:predicted RNase H-like HicB family nuclease